MTEANRIILARRPCGAPTHEDFRLETVPVPAPGAGEALVRTLWLSLDPYMRGRMNEGASYAPGVVLGEPMQGECVGVVEASRDSSLRPGDLVRGHGGWQDRFALPVTRLTKLDGDAPPQAHLGVLGMPGLTAYAGLEGIAKPKAGETVVVGAATGAVGAIAGQLAKLLAGGCRTVGVAGGPEKCAYAEAELGYDRCLDRKAPDLAGRLGEACPDGIDVYVELTGGEVTAAVLPLLNTHARMPVIGTIAHYNESEPPPGGDRLPWLFRQILVKRLTVQGLIVYDWAHLEPDFHRDVGPWVREGRLRYREDVVEGLEQAPSALIGLLEGRNFGKLLVRVGPDPA